MDASIAAHSLNRGNVLSVLFVIIALLLIVMLLSGMLSAEARRARHRERVLERGAPFEATVLSARPTGLKRGGLAEVAFELELSDGRRAQAHEWLTPREMMRFDRGTTLDVTVSERADSLDVVVRH